jgi:D-3-phosphoglycerate dehydrogenase
VRANGWIKPGGISLASRTAAIVGFGDIGRQTAKRLLASEMRVIAYDTAYAADPALSVEHAAWPERVGEADFLIFTCPLNAATRGMFNVALIPRLKHGVRLINVGRGPVVEEVVLIAALRNGAVHSAALDVFEVEPLPLYSPLRDFPKCIFGSHNASNTVDAVRRVSARAIDLLFHQLGVRAKPAP